MKRNPTKGEKIDVNVNLPKHAPWRVLDALLDDLEVCSADHVLHGAIRSRDPMRLLQHLSRYDARSIIERLGDGNLKNASSFFKLYQVGALIKKFPFKGIDTFAPALEKFQACEQQCHLYNTQNYRALVALSSKHPEYYGLLQDLQKEIRDLLGDTPDLDMVYVNGRHGPGQTAGGLFRNGAVTDYFKYSTLPYTVTSNALPHAKALLEADPQWIGALMDEYRVKNDIPMWNPIDMDLFWSFVFRIIEESEITSVPKTALIDRFIAMEATFNVFLQLGVDHVIREKLKSNWGYDLNTQEKNQNYAHEGSVADNLATLDLKGASDTISLMICYLLLPPGWLDLLLDLRMSCGKIKKTGETVVFSKMSSMGNGFTFVLESLIFGACTRVAMRRSKSQGKSAVYGDDLICPSGAAKLLIDILGLCGFEINEEKSFVSGPFRESCGKDFYLGHNVRPFFISDAFATVPQLFHIVNSLKLLEKRCEWPWDIRLNRTISLLLTWIPPDFRAEYRGPTTDSTDTHLFSEEPLRKNGRGYRYFNCLIERPMSFHGSKFFFRKLMCRPKSVSDFCWWDFLFIPDRPIEKWDWRKKFSRGNAFDVTKRDHTFFKRMRSYVPDRY